LSAIQRSGESKSRVRSGFATGSFAFVITASVQFGLNQRRSKRGSRGQYMVWWHWLVIGFFLAAAELVTPGSFYMLFLGLAGLIVGAIIGIGVPMDTWIQVVVFCVISFGMLTLFRWKVQKRLMRRPASADLTQVPEMTGEIAIPLEDIEVHAVGKVELRGTSWTARPTVEAVRKGQRCRVVRVEGLTLYIRAE